MNRTIEAKADPERRDYQTGVEVVTSLQISPETETPVHIQGIRKTEVITTTVIIELTIPQALRMVKDVLRHTGYQNCIPKDL